MNQGRSGRPVWAVATLLLCIAMVSQGVHDVAIEHLGVPYPTLVAPPVWLPVLGDIVRALFLVLFCLAARERLDQLPLIQAAGLVGLFEVCLSETLRVAIINLFLANDWSGRNWVFMIVDLVTHMIPGLALGSLALLIARFNPLRRGVIVILVAAIASGVLIRLVLTPIAKQCSALLLASVGVSGPEEFFQPPYQLGMLSVIYTTFLEPTIATFVMARLSWHGLPPERSVKVITFTLLILGASGCTMRLLVNSFWVQQPPVAAFLSTGQLFAENMVMAVFAALLHLWVNAGRRQDWD